MSKHHKLDNPDIIPFALYQLGGIGDFVDVEDVFVHCYKIAPARFGWRKHPFPNYKSLSKALRDYEEKHTNHLIKTRDGLGRQLSAEGLEWLKRRLPILQSALQMPGTSPPTRRPVQRILNDLASNPFVQQFLAGGRPELKKHEVSDILLCSPDSSPSVFKERLEMYRATAKDGSREELLRFLDYLHEQHREWFGK